MNLMRLILNNIISVSLALIVVLIYSLPITAAESPLRFLSTQMNPAEEAAKLRQDIFAGFEHEIEYIAYDYRPIFQRLVIENVGQSEGLSLLGGLHGDFVNLHNHHALEDINSILPNLKNRSLVESYLVMGKLNTQNQYYIPWMQATYVMAANKKALEYLPANSDLNNLTYQQLTEWVNAISLKTQKKALGLPIGHKGLMHRFIQGYLYPSFTGSMVEEFKSQDAVKMWQWLRSLWPNINQRSLSFNNMSDPLLSEEVWIAWDHTARLQIAINERPDDFVVFPAPTGPKGKGFLAVLVGLGLPKNSYDSATAIKLINYLTQPEVQTKTLNSLGFFPVLSKLDESRLTPGYRKINVAVIAQSESSNALPSLLPVGLGSIEQEFNARYLLTFTRIILRKLDIKSVLNQQGKAISGLLQKIDVPCWEPDNLDVKPCLVK